MAPPIRVGIDASGLVGSSKSATGLQRYLACLVTHLAERCEIDNLTLYLYFARHATPVDYALGKPLATLQPSQTIRWRVAPLARGWQRIGMGLAMQVDRLDLFHFPSPLMGGYCPRRSIVTFHDLAALSLAGEQTQKERGYLPDALEAGRRATALIAVSHSSAEEVQRYLKRSDVTVIPEGVDLAKFSPASVQAVSELKTKFGLDRYILCVGTLQTRKNHVRLIQAFEQIQDRIPHTLVIAGRDGSGTEAIRAYLAAHPNSRVCCLGYIEDSLLPALYTGADILALPSLWEGFGLPLLEAMACGTPVLTSNTSSLVEIAGEAAVIVDPKEVDAIAHGLYRILSDHTFKEALIQGGLQRAREYSWQQAAQHTISLYHRVAR
ncbi:MAG: glycosyltransferase family 1 protein [Chloroflexota bacterium]